MFNGGQIVKNSESNISLFNELSEKREISLGTIANTRGVDIKAVYFKSDNKSLPIINCYGNQEY